MTTASWALRLPLPHSHIWCSGGGSRGASEVPRAKAATEGPAEGLGPFGLEVPLFRAGTLEKPGNGEVRSEPFGRTNGEVGRREGKEPTLL